MSTIRQVTGRPQRVIAMTGVNASQQQIYSKPPPTAKRKAAQAAALAALSTVTIHRRNIMENSQLLDVVRRPLSPDTQIEVPTSWEVFERVEEILEQEEARYPLLQYDAVRQIAIVVAAPTPLHTILLTELMSNVCRNVNRQGLDENITDRLIYESEATETTSGDSATRRILNGAIRYKINDLDRLLMVGFEVGVSQSYTTLKDAISYAICVLHCPLGITLCINERGRGSRPPVEYYQTRQAMNAAIQQVENDFRMQLQDRPYGPLAADGVTWFGHPGKQSGTRCFPQGRQ